MLNDCHGLRQMTSSAGDASGEANAHVVPRCWEENVVLWTKSHRFANLHQIIGYIEAED